MIRTGLKYLLRGMVFIIYFPIHFLSVCFDWCYTNLIVRPFRWLWNRWIRPVGRWINTYFIVIPLEWLYRNVIKPVGRFLWKYLIKKVLLPLIHYLLIIPLVWIICMLWTAVKTIWEYCIFIPICWIWLQVIYPVLRWCLQRIISPLVQWFWEEILQVVMKWAVTVTNWIFRIIVLIVWRPLKWLWQLAYSFLLWLIKNWLMKPIRWIHTHLIRPTFQWVQSIFR